MIIHRRVAELIPLLYSNRKFHAFGLHMLNHYFKNVYIFLPVEIWILVYLKILKFTISKLTKYYLYDQRSISWTIVHPYFLLSLRSMRKNLFLHSAGFYFLFLFYYIIYNFKYLNVPKLTMLHFFIDNLRYSY